MLLAPPRPRVDEFVDDATRRRFLTGLTAAGLALAGCGTSSPAPESTPTSPPWGFRDDRGEKVSLAERPKRIVAYAAPAAALWYLGVKPVGVFAGGKLSDVPQLEGVDLRGIESLGEVYGEVDLERMARLRPDLIVTAYSPKDPKLLWGFANAEQQAKAAAIAPIVAIDGIKDPTVVIGRFEELAAALGADPDESGRAAVRKEFDDTVAHLKDVTATKPGLIVTAVGTWGGQLSFAKPAAFPALRQFEQWGLTFVQPTGGDEWWEKVSFEQANKYPADLILYDTNPGAMTLQELNKIATWRSLPAVKAGQLVEWQAIEDWSYSQYTKDIRRVIDGVRVANPRVV